MKAGVKKILFFLPSFYLGGAENVVVRLLNKLDRSLGTFHLGVILNRGPLRFDVPSDVSVHDLQVRRARFMFIPAMKLIRSLRPDLIFSTVSRINIGLLTLKFQFATNIKLVIREPSIPSIDLTKHISSPFYFAAYRKLYPKADKIICQSNYMRLDLLNNFGVKLSKITLLHNPIPLTEIEKKVSNTTSPYSSKINIVSCGSLSYVKGYDILLRSFSFITDEVRDIHLTILGDGPKRSELEKLSQSLGVSNCVSFLGFHKDPYIYFKHANLFVSSSRWEGLPNVVLEALACGTPVVAANCPGGMSEIVRDGINGWLAPTENPEALASYILAALEKVEKIRGKPVKSSIRHFGDDLVVQQYNELISDLLETTSKYS